MVLPWMENGSIRRFLGNIVDTGSFDTDELVLRVLNWV